MPAIHLQSLGVATPDGRDLLPQLELTFGPHRTGLVGRNGTGKTTLLRVIAGELSPKTGAVQIDGRLGLLRQAVQADGQSVAQNLGIADALARLARIEAGTADADDFDAADWTLSARAAQALEKLGLKNLDFTRPASTLSGGQRTRLGLAALLLAAPDFLLLDEPTNNLDAEGRAAVTELLENWRGGALVVSHDRNLLRHMDEIVELSPLGAKTYGGNWDAYKTRQALDLAAAEHDLSGAERRLADLARKAQERAERKARADSRGAHAAARGGAPKIVLGGMKRRAEQSSGALSRLATAQHETARADFATARAAVEILTPLAVSLEPSGLSTGRVVLQLEKLTGGPGDIIRDLSLRLEGPERVAIGGRNGAGKTTLIRLATGGLSPTAGTVRITPRHALLDQTIALLDPTRTIRENYLRLNPEDGENACRAALARFMFRADAALQPVGQLSGGEILRAGLAATIGSSRPPELLILDEPSNHLDIHAIAAIEAGLRAYDGALLVVSHDRDFLGNIGVTREIAL